MRNALTALACVFAAACGDNLESNSCPEDQPDCIPVDGGAQLADVLAAATDDQVFILGPGTYELTTGLVIRANGVRLLGQGMGRTILSFDEMTATTPGILVTGDRFTGRGFTIADTPAVGLRAEGADDLQLQSLEVTWKDGSLPTNGVYGLHATGSKRVLIERGRVRFASEAGIFVDQSEDVVVRNNRLIGNVMGIEVGNSKRSDINSNRLEGNTGAIMVLNAPGLPAGNGTQTRVFDNTLVGNNLENFSNTENLIAKLAPGTGITAIATGNIEIFDNAVTDHEAAAIVVLSHFALSPASTDPAYDPYATAVNVHDNRINGAGESPTSNLGRLLQTAVDEYSDMPFVIPPIVWDGVIDPIRGPGGIYPEILLVCFHDNRGAEFLNINFPTGTGLFANQDTALVDCDHPPLPAVSLQR